MKIEKFILNDFKYRGVTEIEYPKGTLSVLVDKTVIVYKNGIEIDRYTV